MLETITRDGVTWQLRQPETVHYSTTRKGGHLFFHSRRDCTDLIGDPAEVSPKVVRTLWEKDAASGAAGENDVEWCETCAIEKVG